MLAGRPGAYELQGDITNVEVPATLQATIGARIDRLHPGAKKTLNAAAVVGMRFDADLLSSLIDDADVTSLIDAQLVDQVRFTPRVEYSFRHPLIRTVAYESQLKSDRAQLHQRLASAIESRASADENAALIAEHLEAAGDLRAAFGWHMRAATWSTWRNIASARSSWTRAQQVADRLADDEPDRMAMRIAPANASVRQCISSLWPASRHRLRRIARPLRHRGRRALVGDWNVRLADGMANDRARTRDAFVKPRG